MGKAIHAMAQRKLDVVHKRLLIEIERLGIDIVVHRVKYKSDGSNGFVPDGEETFQVRGIIKSLSTTQAKDFTPTDGGRSYTITDTLSVIYDKAIEFKMYDWFEVGSFKYTVLQISNVGDQDVYWLLSLAMEPKEVERYGE